MFQVRQAILLTRPTDQILFQDLVVVHNVGLMYLAVAILDLLLVDASMHTFTYL